MRLNVYLISAGRCIPWTAPLHSDGYFLVPNRNVVTGRGTEIWVKKSWREMVGGSAPGVGERSGRSLESRVATFQAGKVPMPNEDEPHGERRIREPQLGIARRGFCRHAVKLRHRYAGSRHPPERRARHLQRLSLVALTTILLPKQMPERIENVRDNVGTFDGGRSGQSPTQRRPFPKASLSSFGTNKSKSYENQGANRQFGCGRVDLGGEGSRPCLEDR